MKDELSISILKNLNLEILQGEFVCIHGSSGAGKTTLLNLIGALDKPTSGKIVVSSHNIENYDEDFLATFRSAYIGYVFQDYNLISTLTAIENIAFAMELAGWTKDHITERSEKLLKMIELKKRANHFPAQLSGGECQRVAFARALANNPPLLLADEPTGNLDKKTALKVIEILENIKAEGKTIVITTHDDKLSKLADRSLYLDKGRLIEQ